MVTTVHEARRLLMTCDLDGALAVFDEVEAVNAPDAQRMTFNTVVAVPITSASLT